MSTQVTTSFVQQFQGNFVALSQQKGSRLRGGVSVESITGSDAYFEQIGKAAAAAKGARHSATVQSDTPHARRKLSLASYVWSDLIDRSDKVKMLADPQNEYLMAGVNAMGRQIDTSILAAAIGTAATGVAGGTSTVLPTTQKQVAVSGGAGSRLNLATLIAVKQKFLEADVDPSLPLYFALPAMQLMALLNDSTITSADYNSVKALVQGQLDSFMGFKFIQTQLTTDRSGALAFSVTDGSVGAGAGDADGYDQCVAWAQDGIKLGIGQDIITKISERDDLNYAVQVYAEMDIGATRMEEVKVVEVLCKDT